MKHTIKPIYRQEGAVLAPKSADRFDLVKLHKEAYNVRGLPAAKKLTRKQRARIRWEIEKNKKASRENKYCLPHEHSSYDLPADYFFAYDDVTGVVFTKDGTGDTIKLMPDIHYRWYRGRMVIND